MPDDTPAGLDLIETADHCPPARHLTLPHRNPMPATPLPLDVCHPGPPVADGRSVSSAAQALHEAPGDGCNAVVVPPHRGGVDTVSFDNLAIVAAVAFLSPLALGLAPQLRVPSVLVEILAG